MERFDKPSTIPLMALRFLALPFLAFALSTCSQRDEDHAREQARQTEQKLKHDSQRVFHETEADAKKASRELNQDLEKAREKARRALDQPDHPDDKDRR
jgi:hypothetical protein